MGGTTASPLSVIICDAQGIITRYSEGAKNMFGWSHEEIVGKQNVAVFHTKENVANLVPRLLKTAAEKGVFEEEITLVKKNGETFKALLNVKPVKQGAQLVGYIGTTRPL